MKRLDLILSLLTPGCRIADIGCDHAYIPISAVSSGAASFAYASDVRRGPLLHAEKNVAAAGRSERIILNLADGLDGAEQYSPDTVIIAGMGGELIADIIDRAPFVKSDKIKLILQPMTSQEKLRGYLLENGFEILSEHIAAEVRRLYQIIVCSYTQKPQNYTDAELYVGRGYGDGEPAAALYKKYITKFDMIMKGKAESGADAEFERRICGELYQKYENLTAL